MLNSFFLEIRTSFMGVSRTLPGVHATPLMCVYHLLSFPPQAASHENMLKSGNCTITTSYCQLRSLNSAQKFAVRRQPACNYCVKF